MQTTTHQTLSCHVPPTATDAMFLDIVQRKVEVYPVEIAPEKAGEHHFRLRLSGGEGVVKAFVDSVREELGSWGGRVRPEIEAG